MAGMEEGKIYLSGIDLTEQNGAWKRISKSELLLLTETITKTERN